tara:strand:- start:189 stop:314 length:126 start_codon:yes stop_codon:yes gene_type:complete
MMLCKKCGCALVLISPGDANRSVTLELGAGEYQDADVTLSK